MWNFDASGMTAYSALVVTKAYEVALENYQQNLKAAEAAKRNGELLHELVDINREILKHLKGEK